jgi:hypothetical protein
MISTRLRHLETMENLITVSLADVSNPPTAAELDALFGAAADGFSAVLDDNGAGLNGWAVWRVNSAWWYVALALAV